MSEPTDAPQHYTAAIPWENKHANPGADIWAAMQLSPTPIATILLSGTYQGKPIPAKQVYLLDEAGKLTVILYT